MASSLMRTDDLAASLHERILLGDVASGTWLRQQQIAAEYGVSRTPVREALRALEARGIVEIVPNRGALVCGPSSRDINEAYAIRAELEGYAAELAARYINDAQLRRLREAEALFTQKVAESVAASNGDDGGDPDAVDVPARPQWSVANDKFHEVVFEASGNARLAGIIRSLNHSFPRSLTWSAIDGNSGLLYQNVEEHTQVLLSIDRRDPAGSRAAMVQHVRHAGELVVRRFEQMTQNGA